MKPNRFRRGAQKFHYLRGEGRGNYAHVVAFAMRRLTGSCLNAHCFRTNTKHVTDVSWVIPYGFTEKGYPKIPPLGWGGGGGGEATILSIW